MRARYLAVAGISAAGLLAAAAFAPAATAASPAGSAGHIPAALSMTHHGGVSSQAVDKGKKGKCGSKIGTPDATPDGIISWNSSAQGLNVAGAADFKCGKSKAARTINKVTVMGYNGDSPKMSFNVTVYKNAPSNEPNNNVAAVCATQTVTGTPTGDPYPTADKTVITLTTPCVAKPGINWIEVQANNSAAAWYWETQSNQQNAPADWRDANGSFGTACTPGYVDGVYMQDCIFGGDNGEEDFMFKLG